MAYWRRNYWLKSSLYLGVAESSIRDEKGYYWGETKNSKQEIGQDIEDEIKKIKTY